MPAQLLDFDQDFTAKVLAYGAAGSGKTTFLASAAWDPRTSPVLHIDFGGNALSLKRFPKEKRPTVVLLRTLEDFNLIYDWLVRRQPANHQAVTQLGLTPGFKTLNFDGFTRTQRETFSKVTGHMSKPIADVPPTYEWPHYNATLGHTVRIATMIFELPMHVFATALEREKDESGVTTYKPMLLGQSAGEVAGIAYTVMRMVPRLKLSSGQLKAAENELEGGEVVSVGLLKPSARYEAKDQHGIGRDWLVNPTVKDMLDGIGVN